MLVLFSAAVPVGCLSGDARVALLVLCLRRVPDPPAMWEGRVRASLPLPLWPRPSPQHRALSAVATGPRTAWRACVGLRPRTFSGPSRGRLRVPSEGEIPRGWRPCPALARGRCLGTRLPEAASTASRGALPCRVLLPALQPPCPCQGLGVWGDVEWLLFSMSPCSGASSVAPRAVPPVGAGCAHCPAVGQLPPAFPLSQLPEPLRHPPGGSRGIQATLPVTPLWFPTSRIGAVLMRLWSPGPRLAALQHARRGAGVLGVWRPLLWGGPGPGFGLSGRGSSNGRKCGARLTSDGGFRGLCGVF